MRQQWEPKQPARGRIVLLHGVVASAHTWWRIGPALAAAGWHAIAPDLPGHGDAPRLSGPLDMATLVDAVERQLGDTVDVLVGHSLGASAALAFARRAPEHVRALVLEEPPGLSRVDLHAVADGIAADADLVRRDRGAITRRERAAHPRWDRRDVDHAVGGLAAVDTARVVDGLRGPMSWNLRELLYAVDRPVLVLAAPDADGWYPQVAGSALRGAERIAVRRQVGDERFVEIDGGHGLHRDSPEQWLRFVQSFAGQFGTN